MSDAPERMTADRAREAWRSIAWRGTVGDQTYAVMLHDTWGPVRILAYWDTWAAIVGPVNAHPDHPGLPCFLKNLRPGDDR